MNVLSFIFIISKHRCWMLRIPGSASLTSLEPGPSASACFLSILRRFPREVCFVLRVPV